jgi:hypothetical protein
VAALKQSIAGTAGTQKDLSRVRKRLAPIKKTLHTVTGFSKKRLSPEGLAARTASPLFLAPATTYPQVLTPALHAKANAGRAEAEAARPGEG